MKIVMEMRLVTFIEISVNHALLKIIYADVMRTVAVAENAFGGDVWMQTFWACVEILLIVNLVTAAQRRKDKVFVKNTYSSVIIANFHMVV